MSAALDGHPRPNCNMRSRTLRPLCPNRRDGINLQLNVLQGVSKIVAMWTTHELGHFDSLPATVALPFQTHRHTRKSWSQESSSADLTKIGTRLVLVNCEVFSIWRMESSDSIQMCHCRRMQSIESKRREGAWGCLGGVVEEICVS